MSMKDSKGFFDTVFDLSFSRFLTTRLVSPLLVVAVVAGLIGAHILIVYGLALHWLLPIVLTPLAFALWVVLARLGLELIVALFRIAENTGQLVDQSRSKKS
jgi:hypothetical protein